MRRDADRSRLRFHVGRRPCQSRGAYVNRLSKDDIPAILQAMGNVSTFNSPFGEEGGSLLLGSHNGSVTIPRNFAFLPMAPQFNYAGVTWENVPWPSYMAMMIIPSSDTTWLRVE